MSMNGFRCIDILDDDGNISSQYVIIDSVKIDGMPCYVKMMNEIHLIIGGLFIDDSREETIVMPLSSMDNLIEDMKNRDNDKIDTALCIVDNSGNKKVPHYVRKDGDIFLYVEFFHSSGMSSHLVPLSLSDLKNIREEMKKLQALL